MGSLPAGTVTFLFTDIEGSSAGWEHDVEGMRTALADHDAAIRRTIGECDGIVLKHTGDGVMAVFEEPAHAVRAAVDAQLSIKRVAVRMGVHTGRAQPDDSGDYFGLTPTRAARVMEAAHGGQILVSAAAPALSLDQLPDGVQLKDLGEQRLRSLERSEHLWQVLHPELQAEFPPVRTAGTEATGNLPEVRTSVVGRHDELKQIAALLAERRLVTITGPGGVGKTTVALLVAADSGYRWLLVC